MRHKIELLPSGIPLIDKTWGGLYRSGTYLLTGPRKSGKTILGLQYAQESVFRKEVCLYFTTIRPKDLMINAASINFDLQESMNNNQVIIVRVNSIPGGDLPKNNDEYLSDYLKDIISVVEQYQPSRLVFDELTPFISFQDLKKLSDVFAQTCESIEENDITSLFIIGEPASKSTKAVANLLFEYSTGVISLQKKEGHGISMGGTITIIPNIGHTEGQFKSEFYIEPYKGIVTDFIPSVQPQRLFKAPQSRKESNYKSLSEIEILAENYSYTVFYNVDDFNLILNNQIALYKTTGQLFTIAAFSLDKEAIEQGLLTVNQLKNYIRLSSDKKDKICLMGNKILVLITKEDQKSANKLIARVKGNLPGSDPYYLNKISPYISVSTIQVNDQINNSDDIFQKLLIKEFHDNN
jgi:circadian clock protein KaiC